MSFNFELHQYYWIADSSDSYIAGKLVSLQPNAAGDLQFSLAGSNQLRWVPPANIVGMIPSPGEVTLKTIHEDLVEAVDITEPSILWNLRQRYEVQDIYSSIGTILIAINPYCVLPELYSMDMLNAFAENKPLRPETKKDITSSHFALKHPPHIWDIANAAYTQLRQHHTRQALVISGESGAGKTETTKKCLQYLSAVSSSQSTTQSNDIAIEDRVLASNPLLESFGNSKTCRNNNSSRFGKWLDINFRPISPKSSSLKLTGAHITQYLLEKSRVVSQSEDERNYHIFYQLCMAYTEELGDAVNYNYLNQSGCTSIEGVDDMAEFNDVIQAFYALNFSDVERDAILNAVKGILFLGNIMFDADGASEGSVVSSDTWYAVSNVSALLGLAEEDLARALTIRTIQVRGEVMVVPLAVPQAGDTRNALAKEIYGRIFSQIVAHANVSLAFAGEAKHASVTNDLSIGLLDIFGFEIFVQNSFEQLCINYANEKLQQYFINYVLKKEQEIYESEGIEAVRVTPLDNEDVLQLLEVKGIGVFSLLDEELRLPQGSDQGFVRKVEKEHKGKSTRFVRDFRMAAEAFEIRHFAGTVKYDATNFMDKNKDKLYDHLEDLLSSSTNDFFRRMMEDHRSQKPVPKGNNKASKNVDTLASRFCGQLQELVTVLQMSEPHFVRCIKPNNTKSPITFDSEVVLRQLRYSGVLEAIQIRKSGYPTRRLHEEFNRAYRVLSRYSAADLRHLSEYDKCYRIIERLQQKNDVFFEIRLGRTMVFYRPDVHNALEGEKLRVGMMAILYLQSAHRRHKAYARYIQLCECRTLLRNSINEGEKLDRCNVAAIEWLQYSLEQCRIMNMISYIIKDGQALLKHLQEVAVCIEQLQELIDNKILFTDVVAEYEMMEARLNVADSFKLKGEVYDEVYSRYRLLESRALALRGLREAMATTDELKLQQYLSEVTSLEQQWGSFCTEEKQIASELHERWQLEIDTIQQCLDVLRQLQSGIRNEIDTNQESAFSSTSKNSSLTNMISFRCEEIESIIACLEGPASSPLSEAILAGVQLTISVYEQWLAQDWNEVANVLATTLESVSQMEPIKLITKSEKLVSLANAYASSIEEQRPLVSYGIDLFVVLPKLSFALEKGCISDACYDVEVTALQEAVDSVKRLDTMGSQAQLLVEIAERVLKVRQCYLSKDYETLLALTEENEETFSRWEEQSKLYAYMERFEKQVDMAVLGHIEENMGTDQKSTSSAPPPPPPLRPRESVLAPNASGFKPPPPAPRASILHQPPPPPVPRQSILVAAAPVSTPVTKPTGRHESMKLGKRFPRHNLCDNEDLEPLSSDYFDEVKAKLTANFLREASIVEHEVSVARRLAFNQYAKDVLLSALEFGHSFYDKNMCLLVIDKCARSDCQILSKALELISSLLRKYELEATSDYKDIREIADLLLRVRELYMNKAFADILSKHESGEFLINASVNRSDQWINSVVKSVEEEINIIVTEAKYEQMVQLLLDGMKTGGVTGSVGRVDKKLITFEKLESDIRASETVLGEDKRPSTLKTLISFAKLLADARRAFKLLDFDAQKSTLALIRSSKLIPPSATKEVEFMSLESDYNECIYYLESGLKCAGTIKYLIPVNGDEENGEMTLNMAVLRSDALSRGLSGAALLKKKLADDISPYLVALADTAECIKQLRDCVAGKQWSLAFEALAKCNSISKDTSGLVINELAVARELIQNELFVSKCETALSSNQPIPNEADIGILDVSKVSIDQLEDCISSFQTAGAPTKKAKSLYAAVVFMRDLRRTIISGDWSGARACLNRREVENIGEGHSLIASREIDVVKIAVDNQDTVKAIKQSLLQEAVSGSPGAIDTKAITLATLTDAVRAASAIPSHKRGKMLRSLMEVCEPVLKGRKTVSLGDWNVVRMLLDLWEEKIKVLEFAVQEVAASLSTVPLVRQKSSEFAFDNESESSSLQFIKEDYIKLCDGLRVELSLVQNHVSLIQLEADVAKALLEDGVSSEMVGKIDLSKIRTDGLESVIERKTALETGSNLRFPPMVEKLCKAAQLMLEIRRAILNADWDSVPALLEEALTGTYHPLPDACRREVQVIRLECENRWIISNISSSLAIGGLEGNVEEFNLKTVNCTHLNNSIVASKNLTARTDEAICLLYTAEVLLSLRKMLVEESIDWVAIRDSAAEFLIPGQLERLHSLGLSEIRLIQQVAENTVVCEKLEHAILHGGPTGEPGFIDISTVDVSHIDNACKFAVDSTIKTQRANQLLNACRYVKSLREALLRAKSESTAASEALSSMKTIISSIFEIRSKNQKDAGWLLCRAEVTLITKDAHINEVLAKLTESVEISARIYAARNAANIGGRRNSIDARTGVLSCTPLDSIIKYIEQLDFSSTMLDNLLKCTKALRRIRGGIIEENWDEVKALTTNDDILNIIDAVPIAMKEVQYAEQEAHNKLTSRILDNILSVDVSEYTEEEDDEYLEELYQVISYCEQTDITSVSARQLLDCARQLYLLRTGFREGDDGKVSNALRWFGTNAHRCPPRVQEEAQRGFIIHQNSLLVSGLEAALANGHATGKIGYVNISTIDTSQLDKLLTQADDIKFQTPEAKDMVELAKMIRTLRVAQKQNVISDLAGAIDQLGTWGKILPSLVIEEVAFARSNLYNEYSLQLLRDALKTFDQSGAESLEQSLRSNDKNILELESGVLLQKTSRRRASYADMNTAEIDIDSIDISVLDQALDKTKKYGILTVEVKKLYQSVAFVRSLRVALKKHDWPRVEQLLVKQRNDREPLDTLAQREVQVVQAQLDMRGAILDLSKILKSGWARCSNGIVDTKNLEVATLVNAIERAERSLKQFGALAEQEHKKNDSKQVESVTVTVAPLKSTESSVPTRRKSQLGALSKEVKSSPASKPIPSQAMLRKTSSSIAASAQDKDPVAEKKQKAAPTPIKQEKPKTNTLQGEVESLLQSARIVANVRKALAAGDIKYAGELSEEAVRNGVHPSVTQELELYGVEIGRALQMMRLCMSLRQGIAEGDEELLETSIQEALDVSVQVSGDLGLLRILERAQVAHKAIVVARKALTGINSKFTVSDVDEVLSAAKAHNISGYLIDNAERRLVLLRQFDASLKDIAAVSGGLLSTKEQHKAVVELGNSLGLKLHPAVKRSRVMLKLSNTSRSVVTIYEALSVGNSFAAASATIRIKQLYFALPKCKSLYALENYPRLRDPRQFSMHMLVESAELRATMLTHTDSPIGTSLTQLTPHLAALSVWFFTHTILIIEKSLTQHIDVLYRNAIKCGRGCVILRDEIYMQTIKQLRMNPDTDQEFRLWFFLRALLKHFPPSDVMENFLGYFLYSQLGQRDTALIAGECLRCMHETIFHFGYNTRITETWDSSLRSVRKLVHPVEAIERLDLDKGSDRNDRMVLRSCREDWERRYRVLANSSHDLTLSEFFERISSSKTQYDPIDRSIIAVWMVHRVPNLSKYEVHKELTCDQMHYCYNDETEEERSAERRHRLRSIITVHRDDTSAVVNALRRAFTSKQSRFDDGEDSEAVFTFDVYRDFILVGLEKALNMMK